MRSCAGALQSITWAYRTRVAPFEPDALHPNADDDQAEQVLRAALVEFRKELSAGADVNNTTLRKRFPESIFKHNQRQPKAGSWSQCVAKTKLFWTEGSWRDPLSWTRAGRARIETVRATKANTFKKQIEKAQCTAYCARFRFPFTVECVTRLQLESPHPTHLLRSGVTVLFCAAGRSRLLMQAHLELFLRQLCKFFTGLVSACIALLERRDQRGRDQRGKVFTKLLLREWNHLSPSDLMEWEALPGAEGQ